MVIDSLVIGSGRPAKLSRINALVGASNAGKSTILEDIVRLVVNREPDAPDAQLEEDAPPHLLTDLEYVKTLNENSLTRGLRKEEESGAGCFRYEGLGPTLQTVAQASVANETWNVLQRPKLMATAVQKSKMIDLLGLRVAYSTVTTRQTLLQTCSAVSPIEAPENLLQALQYAGTNTQDTFAEAYRQIMNAGQIRLDDTQVVSLCLRLASDFPDALADPVAKAQGFAALDRLDDQSDGYQEVASILLGLLLSEGRVVLLDDPASHVPPAVATKLGKWIATHAETLGVQVIVATHNTAFLAGLLTGDDDVTMISVSRQGEQTRIRSVASDALGTLARSPFLPNEEVVKCLLGQHVVVTQSDEERTIYQMVAERLYGEVTVGFVHAHGQPNVAPVTQSLASAGLAVAAIVDMDIFASESVFTELVTGITGEPPLATWLSTRDKIAKSISGASKQAIREDAKDVEAFLEQIQTGQGDATETSHLQTKQSAAAWQAIRAQGLDALCEELRPWTEQLLDELQQKGIFVVPKGQLQGWIDFGGLQSREDWFFNAVHELEIEECPGDLQVFVSQAIDYCVSQSAANRIHHGA